MFSGLRIKMIFFVNVYMVMRMTMEAMENYRTIIEMYIIDFKRL